jgi:hypothetical protein
MPNHEIKQSRREDLRPKNLREMVALNPLISCASIRYLLSFNDERINSFLACNDTINLKEQEYIYAQANYITKVMMTQNGNLDDKLFKLFLNGEDEVIKSLLTFQTLNNHRLEMILVQNLDNDLLFYVGENQTIEPIAQRLVGINKKLDYKLASNKFLSAKLLEELYSVYGDEFIIPLSINPNLSVSLIEQFYKKKIDKVVENLAQNPKTSQWILKELCELDDKSMNRNLALNPSVELAYLEQFQLDSELMMLMSKNRTFIDSIAYK